MSFDPVKEVNRATKRGKQKQPTKSNTTKAMDNGTVSLSFPIDHCIPGYATPTIECRLTPRQSAAIKVLWSSLSERGERYEGGPGRNPKGTTVENGQAAVRWMLDRLADTIEAKTGNRLLDDYGLIFR